MNELSSHIKDFISFLKNYKGVSEKSYTTYEIALKEALNFVKITTNSDLISIDLMPYRVHIKSQAKSTIAKKISLLRSYFDWYKDYYSVNIRLKNNAPIRVPKKLPKPVNTELIKEALDLSINTENLAILLTYSLGLRISELANLRIKDIQNNWVRVTGKGSKQRLLPLLLPVKTALQNYLQTHNPSEFVFENNSKKLSENQLRYKISKTFKKAGIAVSPHQLRHSFATDLLNGGARITDVSELLGHSSLSTTQIYTKLSSSLKLSNYLKAHPLCRK